MNNEVLKTLLKEYEQKKLSAEITASQKKDKIYSQNARLRQIDKELQTLVFSTMKNILQSENNVSSKDLEEKINKLKAEKLKILESIGLSEKDLLPKYECEICNDTGYINNTSTLCNCIKQKMFDMEYNKSNIGNLEKENFDTFSLELYSDEVNFEKYNANISPRKNITNIKKLAQKFILDFDDPDAKNLLFTGNTGLGKTFLSNCIAKEIINKNKTVLYQTSSVLLDTIIDYRFGKENVSKNIYDNILSVDLLIIDDLGTETMNSLKFTELFNIINTRLLNQNNHITKTLISTNLNIQELFSNYDERIVSRFIGHYNICRFFGEDIRIKNRT